MDIMMESTAESLYSFTLRQSSDTTQKFNSNDLHSLVRDWLGGLAWRTRFQALGAEALKYCSILKL